VNLFRGLFERRSIGTSHELLEYLTRGYRSLAGVTVNEATAMQIAAVNSCVSLLSAVIGSLPIDIYERVDERTRRTAATHSLRRILWQPNSWMTWAEWMALMVVHVLLRGNGYSAIIRSQVGDRAVSELLPLHPDKVTVEQSAYPQLALRYKWTASDGRAWVFSQSEILHFRGLSTNGVLGRAVLDDARDVFGVALATQQHAATFWQRGGLPTVVLSHPNKLSEHAKNGLENHFEKTYGGGPDQRRVAVIEEGMKLETLSITAEQAQFLETRKFQRGEIAGLFRVPPHLIGDTEKTTSWGTGIEQQMIGFLVLTVMPWLVGFEQRMHRDLLGADPKVFVKFAINGLMRGDAKARAEFYWRMVQMGALSPNDVRGFEDMNPIADGDIYLQPTNMAPLGTDVTIGSATGSNAA
jgi:HK97 family phage portal protein